jgi:hypothetical protein
MGEVKNAYTITVGSPEGKRQLERHRRRCENNIKMDVVQDAKMWSGFV